MQRSLWEGGGNVITGYLLRPRTITEQVSTVKTTFSSWDNCMTQVYCKWPVIIALVIAGLIVLSVVTCIVRCLCLGYSCCCACFRCLSCCACCGGCCDGKRERPMKYMDAPTTSYNTQGYQAPAPMMRGAREAPQFATFESPSRSQNNSSVSEDALPAMPSWNTAAKKHVLEEVEEEKSAVEPNTPTAGQRVPLVSAAAATGMSSPSIYSQRDPSPFGPRPTPSTNSAYQQSNASLYNQSNMPPARAYAGSPSPENGAMSRFNQAPPMSPRFNQAPPMSPRFNQAPPMSPRFAPNRAGSPASSIRSFQVPPNRIGSPASNYQAPPDRYASPGYSKPSVQMPRAPYQAAAPYPGNGAY